MRRPSIGSSNKIVQKNMEIPNHLKHELYQHIYEDNSGKYFFGVYGKMGYVDLLDKNPNLWFVRDSKGRNLASYAIAHNKIDVFKNLFKIFIDSNGAIESINFFGEDSEGLDLISTAIAFGNVDMINLVRKSELIYNKNSNLKNPQKNLNSIKKNVLFSIFCHQISTCKFLINLDLSQTNDPNLKINTNSQAEFSYLYSDQTSNKKFADLCCVDEFGNGPFLSAILGYLKNPSLSLSTLGGVFEYLDLIAPQNLSFGKLRPMLDEVNNNGNNGFMLAVQGGDLDLLECLFNWSYLAEYREYWLMTLKNKAGDDGLSLACSQPNEKVLSFLLRQWEKLHGKEKIVHRVNTTLQLKEKAIQKGGDNIILHLSEYHPALFKRDSNTLELLVAARRLAIIARWFQDFVHNVNVIDLNRIKAKYENIYLNRDDEAANIAITGLLKSMIDLSQGYRRLFEIEQLSRELTEANKTIETIDQSNVQKQKSLKQIEQKALLFGEMTNQLTKDFLKTNYFVSSLLESKSFQRLVSGSLVPKSVTRFFQSFNKDSSNVLLLPYSGLSSATSYSVRSAQKLITYTKEQEIDQWLEKNNIVLTEPDSTGISVLHASLIQNNFSDFSINVFLSRVGDVHRFLEHMDEIVQNTTMHIAAMRGIVRIFRVAIDVGKLTRKELFEKMRDDRHRNYLSKTPLESLVENSNNVEVLKFLLNTDVKDALSRDFWYYLIKVAIKTGGLASFKQVFKTIYRIQYKKKDTDVVKNSNLNHFIRDDLYKSTKNKDDHPLLVSAFYGQSEIFTYLVKMGDDLLRLKTTIRTSDNMTVLHLACKQGNSDVLKVFRDKVRHLSSTEYFNLLKVRDRFGNTALHYAAMHPDASLLHALISLLKSREIEEVVNIANLNNATAVHMAVYKQNAKSLNLLLERGASIDIQAKSVESLKGPFDGYQLFLATLKEKSSVVQSHGSKIELYQILTEYQLESTIIYILNYFDTLKGKVDEKSWKLFKAAIHQTLKADINFISGLDLGQSREQVRDWGVKIATKFALNLTNEYQTNKKPLLHESKVVLREVINRSLTEAIQENIPKQLKTEDEDNSLLGINESLLVLQSKNEHLKLFHDELLFLLNSSYGVSQHIARGDLEKVSGTLGNEIVIELIAEIIGIAAKLFGEALKASTLPLMAANPAAGAAAGVIGTAVSESSGTFSLLAKLILNYHDQKVKEGFREKASNFIKSLNGTATLNKDIIDHKRFHRVVSLLTMTFLPMIEKMQNTEEVVRLARFLFSRIFYRFSQAPNESDEKISEALWRGFENIGRFFKHKNTLNAPLKKLEKRCLYAALYCPIGKSESRFVLQREDLERDYQIGDIISQTTLLVPKDIRKIWEGYNAYAPKDIDKLKLAQLLSQHFGGLIIGREAAEEKYHYKIDATLTNMLQKNSWVNIFATLQAPSEKKTTAQLPQFISSTGDSVEMYQLLLYLAILAKDQGGVGVYLPKDLAAAEIARKMIANFGFHLLRHSVIPENFVKDDELSKQYLGLQNQLSSVTANPSLQSEILYAVNTPIPDLISFDQDTSHDQLQNSQNSSLINPFNIFNNENSLSSVVARYGFRMHSVLGDGSCFYRSVAYLLQQNGIKVLGFNGEPEKLHVFLRNIVVDHISKNLTHYEAFGHNEGEARSDMANRYDKSNLDYLRAPPTYVAEGEIVALSRILNISFVIIGDSTTRTAYRQPGNQVFYLGYQEGIQHYNALLVDDLQNGIQPSLFKELREQVDNYHVNNSGTPMFN